VNAQPAKLFAKAFLAVGAVVASLSLAQAATPIQRIVSPRGIEAWLVQEPSVPLIALDFAFRGGANQDPDDRPGVGNMVSDLLDEGAADMSGPAYHEQLERYAIELSFGSGRDNFSGSLRTLTDNQAHAVELLRIALNAPHFEPEAVERIRGQIISGLRSEATSPEQIASKSWWATAFKGHPYGRPVNGTPESVAAITTPDLHSYVRQVFARDNLKVGIVGNIDARAAGEMIDRIFGDLPAKADLVKVSPARPDGLGKRVMVDLDVPQSVVIAGGLGIPRNDPDFMAGYIVNHILGGGSFSSRLYREVRETRGLAYSVFSSLVPLDHAALFMCSTATRADRAPQTVEVMTNEIRQLAETGPTAQELADAKSYLKGSFALRFDTSTKIANQLVQLQLDDLGIDYIQKRNGLVEAVTLDDVKRVAKRLLDGNLLVTVVGRPTQTVAVESKGG
jgi:zinc protease